MNIYSSFTYFSIFTLLMLSACSSTVQDNDSVTDSNATSNSIIVTKQQFSAGAMQLGTVKEQSLATTIVTRGYIDVPPGSRAKVSPFYSGYVRAIDVLPGQRVNRGDLLFVMENPQYIEVQQAYLEAKEQLDYLKLDSERQTALAVEKIVSEKTAKKASSDYKVMMARYAGLKEKLIMMGISISSVEDGNITSSISIKAPIAGVITKVNVSRSSYIDASEMALEIVDSEHIHLELEVFEKDIISVKEGQEIHFSVPESGEEIYEGHVYLVSGSVDTENRTVDVHGHISAEDESKFIPGMFVHAEVEVSNDRGLSLPESAVVDIDDELLIAIKVGESAEGYTFEIRSVEIGRNSGGWVEILKPSLKGAEILVIGAFAVIQ